MQRYWRAGLQMLIAVLLVLCGCATTAPDSTVIKTWQDFDNRAPFSNVLLISVAGDFPARVRFEQELVRAFSSQGANATAFYTVVGRRAQLTRKVLNDAITVREFDAVILTRVKGQEQAELVMNRPTGSRFDLFLYDYDELNIPAPLNVGSTVSFVVEVYDAPARKKIWAIESLLFDTESLDSVISDQVAAIVAEIIKDGLI